MRLTLKFNLAFIGLAGISYALLTAFGPHWPPPATALAFIAIWCAGLNLLIAWLVLAPLRGLVQGAERISTGQMDAPDLPDDGPAEFARLGSCFNRMRHSLDKAMHVIAMDSRL